MRTEDKLRSTGFGQIKKTPARTVVSSQGLLCYSGRLSCLPDIITSNILEVMKEVRTCYKQSEPYVSVCQGQSQLKPVVLVSLLIAPPFTLTSVLVWMINYTTTTLDIKDTQKKKSVGCFPYYNSDHTQAICFETWFPPLFFQGRAVEVSKLSSLAKLSPHSPWVACLTHARECPHTPEHGPQWQACFPHLRQILNQTGMITQFSSLILFTIFSRVRFNVNESRVIWPNTLDRNRIHEPWL